MLARAGWCVAMVRPAYLPRTEWRLRRGRLGRPHEGTGVALVDRASRLENFRAGGGPWGDSDSASHMPDCIARTVRNNSNNKRQTSHFGPRGPAYLSDKSRRPKAGMRSEFASGQPPAKAGPTLALSAWVGAFADHCKAAPAEVGVEVGVCAQFVCFGQQSAVCGGKFLEVPIGWWGRARC